MASAKTRVTILREAGEANMTSPERRRPEWMTASRRKSSLSSDTSQPDLRLNWPLEQMQTCKARMWEKGMAISANGCRARLVVKE